MGNTKNETTSPIQEEDYSMTQKTAKQIKEVNILYTYKFNRVNRICFTVLSSNGTDQYNTCFNGDVAHSSCTCPGGDFHNCYHIPQLAPRAALYFEIRKQAQLHNANERQYEERGGRLVPMR
jgi:hypothetical protein